MTRRELEQLKPGDCVRINYGVGTVIRVDMEKEIVVVDFGGQAWFRGRHVVDLPGRGGSITVRGGGAR